MGDIIYLVVSIVLAIVLGIVLRCTFLKDKNEGKFKGFLGWLYDFLKFKKMLLENILRILYLITTVFITLFSFDFIGKNFFIFLLCLTLGNIINRVIYEFSLIALVMCRNTTEINKKLSKIIPNDVEKVEVKKEVKKVEDTEKVEENI